MRITVLTGPLLPVPAVRGGAMQKSWHGLAREMVRAGHTVTIVARTYSGQAATETVEGIHFLRTRGFSQGRAVGWDLMKDFAYALRTLPRLPAASFLVTNDFWVPAIAPRLRPSAGAVVVSAGRFPKGQYRLYRNSALIVAISGAVKSAIVAEQPRLESRTIVIPLPVRSKATERFQASEPNRAQKLLYAGRVHPEKGLELLVRTFARISDRFPQWTLEIVGPTAESEGGGGSRFLESLRTLTSGQRVQFRGPVFEPEALAAVYGSADLFCYPSLAERGEAFGVAALESMVEGVPPVVSDLACFRDFVRDGENGWVFDHRGSAAEERLAAVLSQVMAEPELRQRAAEIARRTAERFTFAAVAESYLMEFERIESAKRTAAPR